MSLVGQVLGKYRVVEQVGRGGMGTVYRAVDEMLHRDVALKILNAELNDPGVGRRFRAEAVAIARLNHPGIATIFELFQHDGQWLMAIEFVRGQTLEDLVAHAGPVSVERAVDLVSQALAALAHAHGMGVVHRDLKPANLMLAESGRLKVMDFGIARVAGTEHLTSAGFLVGTPAYMAPEQVLGHEIDARTDLYAMGCVLYFLVTGKLPFPGTSPLELAESRIKGTPTPLRAVRSDLPVWLEQVLERALARAPPERHQSADAFRDAMRRGLGVVTSTTNPAIPVTNPAIAVPPVSETVRPGSLPVSSHLGFPPPAPPLTDELGTAETRQLRTAPGAAPATAEPPKALPAMTAPTTHVPKRATPLWPVLAVVALVAVAGIWWYRSTATPPVTPPPAVDIPPAVPPVVPPAASDPPTAAAPPPTLPPATPPVTTSPPATGVVTPPAITPVLPPARGAGSGRRVALPPAADPPLAFVGVKLLIINKSQGDDVDADLRFGNGVIVAAPRRAGADQQLLSYNELQRGTFVHESKPRWVTHSTPALAAPPANLDVPGLGVFTSRKRWLVLQGTARYLVLVLPDDRWEQILNTVLERTRVKIDRPGPAKN